MANTVTVIGGGLAGCEAAWQLASRGTDVRLVEMRPDAQTGAHRTGNLAELVCSNSFKSKLPHTASGELKAEMRVLGSLILQCADEAAIPAGEALAVDRERFAQAVERMLTGTGHVEILRQEARQIPQEGLCIAATGPLTSEAMAEEVGRITGAGQLYFYDAVAPIVETDSLDPAHYFAASRYGKGSPEGYLNCPLDKDTYHAIQEAICQAETVPLHDFEDPRFFEGCLPLEEIARRGPETLAHGPWKPVGLTDPRTGRWPYAVIQLRRENAAGTCYSLVACQTRMTWPEQRRIFSMIPALSQAVFLRLGVVHRNTYLKSPALLNEYLQMRSRPEVFFAGQIVGVEGYLESAATGLLAGVNCQRLSQGTPDLFTPPPESMLGALVQHTCAGDLDAFVPMNANFGILPPLEGRKRRKDDRRRAACQRALESLTIAAQAAGLTHATGSEGEDR